MAKIRVNKLALELGLQNDQIIEALQKKEIAVKNHMSSVDEEVAQDIRDLFSPKAPVKITPKAVKAKAKTKIKAKMNPAIIVFLKLVSIVDMNYSQVYKNFIYIIIIKLFIQINLI